MSGSFSFPDSRPQKGYHRLVWYHSAPGHLLCSRSFDGVIGTCSSRYVLGSIARYNIQIPVTEVPTA